MITIHFYSWLIPLFITIVGFIYAIFIYNDGEGYMAGLGNMLMLVPASIISMIAWIVWAVSK